VSASVLSMSMSLDGYIADPNDLLGGDDDHRLHNWFAPGGAYAKPSGPAGELLDEQNAAVLCSWDGGLPSSWINGVVTMAVSRSSWSVTGRPARPPVGAIHW
jgi:hypothetical protein